MWEKQALPWFVCFIEVPILEQLYKSTLNCFDEIIHKPEVMGLHPCRPGALGRVSADGAQRPPAVPAHTTGWPEFGVEGR